MSVNPLSLKLAVEHEWDLSPSAAIALQQQLREQVITHDQLGNVKRVAGVDVGFRAQGTITRAAIAVLSYPELELVDSATAETPTSFPYVPGLLSFRELPTVLVALAKLKQLPDLWLCDGQGIAHPRRFGIACHLGVLTDMPAIGVGKTRLCGRYDDVPTNKGGWVSLIDKNETIGAVLRSREQVKPVFISTGHRISLATAIDYVMACTTRFKLPETTRHAHRLASD